jgi:hypothetical protein
MTKIDKKHEKKRQKRGQKKCNFLKSWLGLAGFYVSRLKDLGTPPQNVKKRKK